MARDVAGGSFRERILRLLAERYPITVDEVAVMLGLRPDVVRLEVKRLRALGLVVVESPGGTDYVALSGAGFRVVGLPGSEAARLRKQGKPPSPKPRDPDDPAFM